MISSSHRIAVAEEEVRIYKNIYRERMRPFRKQIPPSVQENQTQAVGTCVKEALYIGKAIDLPKEVLVLQH